MSVEEKINNGLIYWGMPLQELLGTLGTPTDSGGTSRKYKFPCVFKYDTIEFCFTPAKYRGQPQFLELVIDEQHNILLAPKRKKESNK